jgi:D-mannonate dehydratase
MQVDLAECVDAAMEDEFGSSTLVQRGDHVVRVADQRRRPGGPAIGVLG